MQRPALQEYHPGTGCALSPCKTRCAAPPCADWPCLCLPRLAGRLHRHALLAQRNPHRPPNAHGDRGAGSLEESLSETHALPDQPGKRFLIISELTRDYYVVFLYRGVWKIAQRPGPGADQELPGVFW